MQICTVVKLHTTLEQHAALVQTLRTCNLACERISQVAFETGTFRRYDLHHACYYNIKAETNLHAQPCCTLHCQSCRRLQIGQSGTTHVQATRSHRTGFPLLRWFLDEQAVGITTLQGRIKVPFLCSAEQKELLQGKSGQADLMLRDGVFYLCVAVTVPEAEPFTPCGCIGVDLGIVNVATDSEGHQYTGEPVRKVRRKYRRLRQLLQPEKTRSARKHLQKVRRKESRFVKDVNHCISKALVCTAIERQKALAIECLTGISKRGNGFNRAMRTELNNWSFHQLKTFLTYKARRAGVPLVEVDPRYSSQTCSTCGHCERANRTSPGKFLL